MSREIKFRAWDKREKRYRYDFAITSGGTCFDLNEGTFDDGEMYERNYPLEQYTGLDDKEGKEIWEGDLVTGMGNKGIYVVKHGPYSNVDIDVDGEHGDSYGWFIQAKCDELLYGETLWEAEQYLKVIGNIHENPELLEGKE